MKEYDKLIFVSTGNTAVSPMAEAILQELFKLEDILIESKGLVVLFPEPINPKAEAVLVSQGLSMKDHMSVAFSKDDFDERTLILAMDDTQKEKIVNDFGDTNVYTLPEFIGSPDKIPDPYGRGVSEYGQCYEQLKAMVTQLAEKLKQEES